MKRNYRYRNRRNKSSRLGNSLISTIVTGIAGMITKDLVSENSKIKKLFKKFTYPKKIEDKSKKKKVIDAEYSVIDDKIIKTENSN